MARTCLTFLTILAALSLGANDLTDNIIVKGGTVVEDGAGAVVTYTRAEIEAAGEGSLQFKAGSATADILAVGGGGGGGGSQTASTQCRGGGGGGGAGGFVEQLGLLFKGSYQITVGAGGAGAPAKVTQVGTDGGDSCVVDQDGNPVTTIAKGGGGGGSQSAGHPGGSGGGGSLKYVNSKRGDVMAGGAGTAGQGNDGGGALTKATGGSVSSGSSYIGAGGGGAGGQGTDVTIYNQAGGAPGGVGKQSQITGLWYAGGGAGADSRTSGGTGAASGGDGGGGNSGDGQSYTEPGARDGKDGFGGGGGGGSYAVAAGKGGDGVVVIRLTNYVAGGVVLPTIPAFEYDGQPKVAAVETVYYTLSRDVEKTDAGDDYELVLTLTDAGKALGWDDPSITGDSTTIRWSIAKLAVKKPVLTEESFTYTGEEQTGFAESARYTLSAANKATNAGTYTPTATLTDAANTKWDDGAPTTRTDLSWTIAKLKVAKPVLTEESFTYTGEEWTGYAESVRYTLSAANKATNAGTYTPTAKLTDAANTAWADGQPAERTDLSWTIGPLLVNKPSAKTGLVFNGEVQAAYEPTAAEQAAFSLSGHEETNAGDYSFTATLNNAEAQNYKWKNGDYGPLTVSWSIAPRVVDWPPAGAQESYPYEPETTRTPVPTSSWYELEGNGSAADAGDYSCIATLKFNDTVANVNWSDGSTGAKTWNWHITPITVELPSVQDFTYAESPKGTATAHTVLTIPADALYSKTSGDELTQSQVRTTPYRFVLELKDSRNYCWSDGTSEAKTFQWQVLKADNVIEGVKLDSWQFGDTTLRAPSCTGVKFGLIGSVSYAWSTSPDGSAGWTQWDPSTRPTEVGTYYLKAKTPAAVNWNAAEVVKRFCVWTNPAEVMTDYVDITLTGVEGGKPVDIDIGEAVRNADGTIKGGLPGFEYARAGKQAGEIRFVLTNAVKLLDKLLPFTNVVWNAGGTSKLRVMMPAGVPSTVTIRMYWHAADGNPRSDNYPEDVTGAAPAGVTASFSLVNREGVFIDYWTKAPSIDESYWPIEEPPTEENVHFGKLKDGTVLRYCLTMPRGTTNETLQTAAGTYDLVFTRQMTLGDRTYAIFDGERRVTYEIIWHNTFEDLGGTAGGRVLLGNNDTLEGHEIAGQARWQNAPSLSATYWETEDDTAPYGFYPNLEKGVYHTLYLSTVDGREVLWRLRDTRLGSQTRNNRYLTNENYLPWSPTSQPRTEDAAMSNDQATCLVMRNKGGFRYDECAAIYSPCYTNGIGTIYFDAVNGFTADGNAYLIVEVATNTANSLPPTDDNCRGPDGGIEPYYYLSRDANGVVLPEQDDYWVPYRPTVLVKQKGENEFHVDATQTFPNDGRVHLKITGGASDEAFYRLLVPVNEFGPCRFRIRRPMTSGTTDIDRGAFIAIDNILVSLPAMSAALSSPGESDQDSGRTGKQTLGQACALTKAFPAIGDTGVAGRAVVNYNVTRGVACDPTTFIASARFNYRWRYLNQSFGDWRTLYLDHTELAGRSGELMSTVGAIDFTGRAGDVEWYYDLTLHAPAYKYTDYSGSGVAKPVGDYNEEIRAVTNAMHSASPLASAGTDWFVRLREGRSDWQAMRVSLEPVDKSAQPIAGEYDMELVEDNMWRALVPIPEEAEGRCTFFFRGFALHPDGDPDRVETDYEMFGVKEENVTNAIPANGFVEPGGHGVTITLDHAAGYLEFRMSDRFLTYQIGRAEYQDFNSWTDAHTAGNRFRADPVYSNSVDVVRMKRRPADMAKWEPFEENLHNVADWNETFYRPDYDPTPGDRFDKEVFHYTHETPNDWSAQNITFVSERFVKAEEQKTRSGMAGKLLGSGSGKIDFTSAIAKSMPSGLEKVSLTARLGQSYTFDAISYDMASYNDDNYLFFAPVTMSHHTLSASETPTDMAVGASASLIGYYTQGLGCYEFRVERLYVGDKVRLSIHKWYVAGYQWQCERLAWRDFDASLWNDEETVKPATPELNRGFYGMFISFESDYNDEYCVDVRRTKIICGLSDRHAIVNRGSSQAVEDLKKPWQHFSGMSAKYVGLTYEDTTNPYGWGSYGVVAKDCPAKFMMPAHQPEPYSGSISELDNTTGDDKSKVNQGGKYFTGYASKLSEQTTITFADALFEDDRGNLFNPRKWVTVAGRCEPFEDRSTGYTNWKGLRTPTNLVQDVELYLKKKGSSESEWKLYGQREVRGYGFSKLEDFDLKLPGNWDLRLQTGSSNAVDVVVDDVVQYRWQAPDMNDPGKISDAKADYSGEFVFSQGVVVTNKTARWQGVRLQPARALDDRPVSVRGPVIDGIGKFTFDYCDADAAAEVWVQVATNTVDGNLSGANGYNNSISSVALGEEAPIGTWMTVAKYSTTATDPDLRLTPGSGSGSKTVYLGWHNHHDRPVRGLYRLFVPPAKVTAAVAAAKSGNLDYASITVKAASCTDEPGLSERSWRGWNMRTVGDSTDSERRMNLVDMLIDGGGQGLVCALNNSTYNVEDNDANPVEPDDKRLITGKPAIYSPTMKPTKKNSGVGSVAIKARLYSTGQPETEEGGRIVIWGAKDSRASVWTPLYTNVVTSSVFSNFVWNAGHEAYLAIKLEVTDAAVGRKSGTVDRVILDEVVIGEKVPPTIDFLYARPFRMNLFSTEPIDDIMSPAEQPLAGESWGVQTQLALQQIMDEIDLEKGFEVCLSYFRGTEPWGYGKWKDHPDAVTGIPLRQVGDASNLVFRSVGETPESLVGPAQAGGEVVQFMLTVKYWDRSGEDELQLTSDWEQPAWFYPLDYNAQNGGDSDQGTFAAYTVLDTVSPGRAWINEVSWNDGTTKENGGTDVKSHQFVEICVPVGVDMTGWYLRVTDFDQNRKVFARLGDTDNGIPGKKDVTANCTNGYEFLVLQSPESTIAEADARWYATGLGSDVKGGTLSWGDAYQFELVRPSGIVEQQFVMDGTNEWSQWSWGAIYDGTNLVNDLFASDLESFPYVASPKRFWAGAEVARQSDGTSFASTGVVGGEEGDDTARWPGGRDTWKSAMAFTPGRLNVGQTIPEGWFLAPNGTNAWVYFSVSGDHVSQNVGGDANRTVLAVVPQGETTNVTYTVDNWYELSVRENDRVTASGAIGTYRHEITPTGTVYVVASAVPQAALADEFGLGSDNPYSPSVRAWLEDRYRDYNASDIRLARFQGLRDLDDVSWLTLTEMYWLDIPPVPETEEERMTNDGTNWWFRGGMTKIGIDHPIERQEGSRRVTYVNKQVEVQLYMTNACTHECHAPQRLQGLDYAKSDDFVGVWTSVTFKITGKIDLSTAEDFLPFRTFTFDSESFTDAGAEKPFTATIDILDPFKSPIGRNYGWDKHPGTSANFKWKVDTDFYPYTIEKLKYDSTYKSSDPVEP